MSDLFVLISDMPDAPWHWIFGTESGSVTSETELQTLAGQDRINNIIVILPGTGVTTHMHALENIPEKQKRQAVGFSIEDALATPVENTHIAFDPESDRISIIDKHWLDELLDRFSEAGLAPDIVCADYEAVVDPGRLHCASRVIVRDENGLGFSHDVHLDDEMTDGNHSVPKKISGIDLLMKIRAARLSGHTPLNLLQGAYQKRTAVTANRWARVGALVAGLVLAFLVVNIGQGLLYRHKADTAKTEMYKIYAQVFPGQDVPDNPLAPVLRAQMERSGDTGNEFIELSSVLIKSVNAVEGVEISNLRYDSRRGEFNLSLMFNSFEDSERLKTVIAQNGGHLTEGDTRQNARGLTGDAVLKLRL